MILDKNIKAFIVHITFVKRPTSLEPLQYQSYY